MSEGTHRDLRSLHIHLKGFAAYRRLCKLHPQTAVFPVQPVLPDRQEPSAFDAVVIGVPVMNRMSIISACSAQAVRLVYAASITKEG